MDVVWYAQPDEVFTPDAFAGSISQPLTITGWGGTWTGTVLTAVVAGNGTEVHLTVEVSDPPA
jgi:hypothetical protein